MFPSLQRKRFSGGRTPLSDAEFMLKLGVSEESHLFVARAREALARVCHIPASVIYPEDAPASLVRLVGDWDDLVVALELEAVLGISIDEQLPRFIGWRFFWRGEAGPRTVGEWAIRVAQYLESRLHDDRVA
jgi:hypothetical protein